MLSYKLGNYGQASASTSVPGNDADVPLIEGVLKRSTDGRAVVLQWRVSQWPLFVISAALHNTSSCVTQQQVTYTRRTHSDVIDTIRSNYGRPA